MANQAPITLSQLFRFNRGYTYQLAAISELEEDLSANGYEVAMRRDRPWFQTWSQSGKQDDLGPALKLIKKYEGCRLTAYNDGVGVCTIGWGTTRYPNGRPVSYGDTITQAQADQYLKDEVESTYKHMAKTIPHWREMNANQRGVLTSFAYNLGKYFYGSPEFNTITRVLRDRRWHEVPAALYLYRNPGSNVEAGLARRRREEGAMWNA
jgi:GH24 family phage-related lysozyme (muramidase)